MSIEINSGDTWKSLAACRNEDPFLFESRDRAGIEAAKKICATCTVRSDCLDFALQHPGIDMIFGGLTLFERKQVQRGERDRNDLSVAEEQFKDKPPLEATAEN